MSKSKLSFFAIFFLSSTCFLLLNFDWAIIKTALGSDSIVYHVKTTKKVVALTFDDGPDPRYTTPMLDTLREFNAQATFFVVGQNVLKHPEILQVIVRDGHEIGNHTMNHPRLPDLTPEEVRRELSSCSNVIHQLTGQKPYYFRSPKGLTTPAVASSLARLGMREIHWSMTIENRSAKTPEEMANRIISKIKPGHIILLHDGRLDRTNTVKALPILLVGLKQQGYQVVTLSELLDLTETERIHQEYYTP